MSYSVIAPTDVQSIPRTFQILQTDFNKIGVQLKEQALDSSAAFAKMTSPNNTYQGFDLAMWDWTALIDPDFMLSVVTCAQYGGWSDSGYCNKKLRQDVLGAAGGAERSEAPPDRLGDAGVSVQAAAVPLARERRLRGGGLLELGRLPEHAAGPLQRAEHPEPDASAPEVGGFLVRGTDYVLKRVVFAIVTVFVAVTINFVLFRLAPGTAVTNLSRVPHATQQLRHALEVQFGLDKSKWQQYVIYLKQLAHGNLGISYENQQPVSTNLRIALINTLPMVTLGTAFAIVFGIVHRGHRGLAATERRPRACRSAPRSPSTRCPRNGSG